MLDENFYRNTTFLKNVSFMRKCGRIQYSQQATVDNAEHAHCVLDT